MGRNWLGDIISGSGDSGLTGLAEFSMLPNEGRKSKPASNFGGASWNLVGKCFSTLIVSALGSRGLTRSHVCRARETSRIIVMFSPQ